MRMCLTGSQSHRPLRQANHEAGFVGFFGRGPVVSIPDSGSPYQLQKTDSSRLEILVAYLLRLRF